MTPRPRRSGLGVADWILLAVSAISVGALAALHLAMVGSFVAMYRDFGSPDALPALTRLVVAPGFAYGVVAGVLVLGLLGAGLRAAGVGRGVGTAMLAVSAAVGALAIPLVLWGLYAPIWQLADRIRP